MMDRFVGKYQRKHRVIVETPFFGFANADTFAKRMGGWVTDGAGRILADYRPRWRRKLAGFFTAIHLWTWRLRARWAARRMRRLAMRRARR